MSKAKLSALTQALRLPQAQLQLSAVPALGIKLHLLHLPQAELRLSAAQTAYFWQNCPTGPLRAGGQALARFILRHPSMCVAKPSWILAAARRWLALLVPRQGQKRVGGRSRRQRPRSRHTQCHRKPSASASRTRRMGPG